MLFQTILPSAILLCGSLLCDAHASQHGGVADAHGKFGQRHRDRYARAPAALETEPYQKRADESSFRYLNKKTSPYKVDSLPEVPYDIGEMYSGNVPINMSDTSRALFFVYQPTIGPPVDEVTIWLNGGPGCSSLEGFFQENGRFIWQPGTFAPVENPYSWVNLTNMLWVEQPVGTGFAIGKATATTEEEIAQDFIHFFKNFEQIFGIKNYKIYVTGESYAGRYVPYISAAMLDEKDTEYYNLKGALTYDPCIGQFDYLAEEATVVPLVQNNANLFNFNASFMAELDSLHKSCGYEAYIDEYLTFPPPHHQPTKFFNYTSEANCDVFDMVYYATFDINPCFDLYEINSQCPIPWDVLSFPTSIFLTPAGADTYFNRADVKAAMHAPDVTWAECSAKNPFKGGDGGPEQEGDLSANPTDKVLPQVIEATNRVLVANGDFDMVIITNGTLLSIQNMTWNGALGFQQKPSTPIEIKTPDLVYEGVFADKQNNMAGVDGPQGYMGLQHYERGLMWAETFQSGHMEPEYQPRSSYRHIQWVLGRIDAL